MDELIKILKELKDKNKCDGLKVYFCDEENYCVKGIRDGEIVFRNRKSSDKWKKHWDLKNDNRD